MRRSFQLSVADTETKKERECVRVLAATPDGVAVTRTVAVRVARAVAVGVRGGSSARRAASGSVQGEGPPSPSGGGSRTVRCGALSLKKRLAAESKGKATVSHRVTVIVASHAVRLKPTYMCCSCVTELCSAKAEVLREMSLHATTRCAHPARRSADTPKSLIAVGD